VDGDGSLDLRPVLGSGLGTIAWSKPAHHPTADTAQQITLMIAFADEVSFAGIHDQLARHTKSPHCLSKEAALADGNTCVICSVQDQDRGRDAAGKGDGTD
jgi:hypothetical protein